MANRGYYAEYEAKKILQSQFGKFRTIKMPRSGYADFFAFNEQNQIVKVVEVKKRKKEKVFKPRIPHDIEQFYKLKKFTENTHIPVECWIKLGKSDFRILSLEEYGNEFIYPNQSKIMEEKQS